MESVALLHFAAVPFFDCPLSHILLTDLLCGLPANKCGAEYWLQAWEDSINRCSRVAGPPTLPLENMEYAQNGPEMPQLAGSNRQETGRTTMGGIPGVCVDTKAARG